MHANAVALIRETDLVRDAGAAKATPEKPLGAGDAKMLLILVRWDAKGLRKGSG